MYFSLSPGLHILLSLLVTVHLFLNSGGRNHTAQELTVASGDCGVVPDNACVFTRCAMAPFSSVTQLCQSAQSRPQPSSREPLFTPRVLGSPTWPKSSHVSSLAMNDWTMNNCKTINHPVAVPPSSTDHVRDASIVHGRLCLFG